jgi:hypothetical protein
MTRLWQLLLLLIKKRFHVQESRVRHSLKSETEWLYVLLLLLLFLRFLLKGISWISWIQQHHQYCVWKVFSYFLTSLMWVEMKSIVSFALENSSNPQITWKKLHLITNDTSSLYENKYLFHTPFSLRFKLKNFIHLITFTSFQYSTQFAFLTFIKRILKCIHCISFL